MGKKSVLMTSLIFISVILMMLMGSCGINNETPIKDFDFSFESGEVRINSYKGADRQIIIPKVIEKRPVTKITSGAFNRYDLISIVFPEGFKSIGASFCGCDTLKSVVIPDSIEYIDKNAFRDTVFDNFGELESGSVLYINDICYGYYDEIYGDIKIKPGTRIITENAFDYEERRGDRKGYVVFHVPDSVEKICKNAFGNFDEFKNYQDRVIICASKGSTAEKYAKDNNIYFITKQEYESIDFPSEVDSIEGTWKIVQESGDEASDAATEYYTFGNDGTASITLGTMKVVGTWNYVNDEDSSSAKDRRRIDIEIYTYVDGTFYVECEGNVISGRTMTLRNKYMNEPVKFEEASIPRRTLKVDKSFEPDERITGTWYNDEVDQTFVFNADGTCTVNQMDELIIDGVYTIDEKSNVITVTYLRSDKQEMDIDYDTSGGDSSTLTLLDLEYERVE